MVQTLSIAGGLKLDLEITRYDPPRGAESRAETNGVKLAIALRADAERRRHDPDPVARRQGGRDHGADADPRRPGPAGEEADRGRDAAQGSPGGLMRTLLAALVALLAFPRRRGRAGVRGRERAPVRSGLRRPERRAGRRGRRGRAAKPDRRQSPTYVAVLPAERGRGQPRPDADRAPPGRGRGGPLRAGRRRRAAHAARRCRRGGTRRTSGRHAGGAVAVHRQRAGRRVRRRRRHRRPDRGCWCSSRSPPAACSCSSAAAASAPATASPRPARPTSTRTSCASATASAAIELDVTLTENAAAKADYDRAVDAYDRANAHQRKGDEPAADRALDEGLAAIGSAQERLAGRKPR